jgi:hypothetical protein
VIAKVTLYVTEVVRGFSSDIEPHFGKHGVP